MQPNEPYPDVPNPTLANEETVDPTQSQGNRNVVVIRRHPFGIISLWLEFILALGVSFALLFYILPNVLGQSTQIQYVLSIIAIIISLIVMLFLLVATAIYKDNHWVITDDSITQFLRTGIFRSSTSELSMANIEDVTAEENGALAHTFSYGVLRVETAGEQLNNFHFYYCPHPNTYAKIILDARERFIREDPIMAHRANDGLQVPRSQTLQPPPTPPANLVV